MRSSGLDLPELFGAAKLKIQQLEIQQGRRIKNFGK